MKKLLIIMLAIGLFAACANEKKNDTKSQNVITLTTEKAVGDSIELTLNADVADQADIWIDLNNNSKKDEGETVTEFGEEGLVKTMYTLGAQTVSIYGKVTHLTTVHNGLTALDVSGNPLLVDLNCNVNSLTSLDISKNTALIDLSCFSNNIASLDVTNNKLLEELLCGNEELTSLKLANPVLDWLDVDNSSLTNLDVSGCPLLEELSLYENHFTPEGLKALFNSLPEKKAEDNAVVDIRNNPGSETIDTSIAEGKNWKVNKVSQ